MRTRAGERRIIGGRYELGRIAGSGGSGRVYQAVDLSTGAIVAVKLLMDQHGSDVERFAREAALLERMRHEGIVHYLGHGKSEEGFPFLVMEWLDGVPLSEALDAEFGLARSIALMKRVAAALAYAHRQGVVHRDIKPSNIFLVGGRAELAKLIDFGLALGPGATERVTGTGVPVGTPAFMAPEVIQGGRGGTPASDVFSLGALFYRCLVGHPPFSGPNLMSILAKVVVSHPPPVRELKPFVPASIDRIVTRMLQKEPDDRFADAGAVLAALLEAETRLHDEVDASSSSSTSLGIDERRLISVLTSTGIDVGDEDALRTIDVFARRYMAEALSLATGHFVLAFGGAGEASDMVSRAARCALELRAVFPEARFAMVTGPGDPHRHLPDGDVIDAAAVLLGESARRGSIVLDLPSKNLLEGRFATRQEGSKILLESFAEGEETGRVLLGRSTPFVGRKRELRMALSCFEGVVEDRVSTALIITGQAGIGKSRLREELVERMRQSPSAPQILIARADPVYGGAYDLARRLVCVATGVRPEFPAVAVQALIRARVERVIERSLVHETVVFLSELAGAPFERDHEVGIAVVRSDTQLLGDRMKIAFGRWLAAEAAAHSTVVVLEDLEHADRASIDLLEEAMRQAEQAPLFVLGLARPSIDETLPAIFRERRRIELCLGPLPDSAVRELVQSVAYDIDGIDSDSLAERTGGNPLLVEELIRAAAAGRASGAPQSVLAMLQSRFEGLSLHERRVARLASVFGEAFTKDAIVRLAGEETLPSQIDEALQSLVRNEIIERVHVAAAPPSYRFRSSYWREAAYATFTEQDRVNAHRVAGEYLASRGGTSALELAHHFEEGRDPRAVEAYSQAAALALASGDAKSALACVDRGASIATAGPAFGRLRRIEAEAQKWAGSNERVVESAREALTMLEPGSEEWLVVLGELAAAEGKLGNPANVFVLGDALESAPHVEGKEGVRAVAAARIAMQMALAGDPAAATVLLAKNVASEDVLDPVARGYVFEARSVIAGALGRRGERVRLALHASLEFEVGGDRRNAALLGGSLGFAMNELGLYERAKVTLSRAIELADAVGAKNAITVARTQLARAQLRTGGGPGGKVLLREAIRELVEQKNGRLEGVARVYLAEALLEDGDPEAGLQVERAVKLLDVSPPMVAPALAVLARVRAGEGKVDEALELVNRAADIARTRPILWGEGMVRYSRFTILELAQRYEESRASRERAKAWLEARVEELDDPEFVEAFLAIPEHRAILDS